MAIRELTSEDQELLLASVRFCINADRNYIMGHSSFPDAREIKKSIKRRERLESLLKENPLFVIEQ